MVHSGNTKICFSHVVSDSRSPHNRGWYSKMESKYQHHLCSGNRKSLFFFCGYKAKVWSPLMRGLLGDDYSTEWNIITTLVKDSTYNQVRFFIIRYAIHATVRSIWHERNGCRHGVTPSPSIVLEKYIDRTIRNKLSTIRLPGNKEYQEGLQVLFGSRPTN